MSISAPMKAPWSVLCRPESRHRFLIWSGALAVAAVVIAVAVFGSDYYLLKLKDRPHSPKHALLKPGGSVGVRLGMLGFAVFFMAYLYPIRKHWKWLGRIGISKRWLDYHILAGLTAPIIITFHSSFKMNGIAGVAYWIMIAAVISGIVGRYFYAQIPRHLSAAEMSLLEMEELSSQWAHLLAAENTLPPEEVALLLTAPKASEVEHMSLVAAIIKMIWLDIHHAVQLQILQRRLFRRFRNQAAGHDDGNPCREDLKQVINTLRRQVSLSHRIVFYSKIHQIFNLWHVIHRPFPYSFAILALIHVAAVLLLGYF